MGANKCLLRCCKCGKEAQVWNGLSKREKQTYTCWNCIPNKPEKVNSVLRDLGSISRRITGEKRKVSFICDEESDPPNDEAVWGDFAMLGDEFDDMDV